MVHKKHELPGKADDKDIHCYDNELARDLGDEKCTYENSQDESTSGAKEQKQSKRSVRSVPFLSLFKHSDVYDKVLMFIGIIGAIIQGISSPFMIIIFGQLADSFVQFSSCFERLPVVEQNPAIFNGSSNCSDAHGINFGAKDLSVQMAYFAIYYLICSAVVLVCGFMQVFSLSLSTSRQTKRIRILLFRSIMQQEMEWIENCEAHAINTKLDEDVTKIGEAIGDKSGFFMQSIAGTAFGLGIGFYNEWKLTLVVLSAAPLLAGATSLMGKLHLMWCAKEDRAYVKAGSIVESVLKNIRTVVAYGTERKEVDRYNEKLNEAKEIAIKKGVLRGSFQGLIWCALILTFALAFWYGSGLVLDRSRDFTIGNLLTVFLSIMYAISSLGHAASIADAFFSAKSAAAGIYEIIERESLIDSSSDSGDMLPLETTDIKFENVSYTYPTRNKYPALRSYSASFASGKIYAITGTSGSGKSTILKLIQRLYSSDDGKITLNNRNINSLNVGWLRSNIGVVKQEPILFATTIKENITLGHDEATIDRVTDDDVIQAAKAANAYDFIMDLPEKFDTFVGVQGCQLSGGQKQRIAIARALLRKPKILLMDQACSALDSQSEKIVLNNLSQSRLTRTTILVTHRNTSISIADHVLDMNNDGCIFPSTRQRKRSSRSSITPKNVDECRRIGYMNKYNEENDAAANDSEVSSEYSEWKSITDSDSVVSCEKDLESRQVSEENKVSIGLILKENRTEWPMFFFGSFASLLNGAIQPIFAVILSAVIGVHGLPADTDKKTLIDSYCLIMAGLGGISFLAYLVQGSMFAISGEMLTRRLRKKTFAAILRQEMSFFDKHSKTSSALPYLLAYYAGQVQGLSGQLIGIIICTTTTVILAVGIALYSGWQLALLQLACFPIIVISHGIQSKMLHANAVRDHKHLERGGQIVLETINAYETVVQLGKESYFVSKFEEVLKTISRNRIKSSVLQGMAYGFAHAVTYLSYAATFRLGAYLIEIGEVTLENLFRVYFVIVFAALSIGRNVRHMPDFTKARESASKIFRFIGRKSSIDVENDTGISQIAKLRGDLELQSCYFNYSTRPNCQVLDNINIRIQNGRTLALVGKSGCGKSTVVQLIERFYDPTSGRLVINGRDARDYNLRYLRSNIGVVFQDPVLFEGTVFENIAYGCAGGGPTRKEVEEAARTANIHDKIASMDDGYDTKLGIGGKGLSRGEKQRIAIARALIRNPAILLLDEATSCLDQESEQAVQKALDKARCGRTTVIIAHNLKTVRNADTISVISQGKVVENGPHDHLMSIRGLYFDMVSTGVPLA